MCVDDGVEEDMEHAQRKKTNTWVAISIIHKKVALDHIAAHLRIMVAGSVPRSSSVCDGNALSLSSSQQFSIPFPVSFTAQTTFCYRYCYGYSCPTLIFFPFVVSKFSPSPVLFVIVTYCVR